MVDDASTAGDATTASPSRRRSGRVSKKPELYGDVVPEPASSGSAKRKRTTRDAAAAHSEDDASASDSDDDESDPDDDDERAPKRQGKGKGARGKKKTGAGKKPALKKPKTNGTSTTLTVRPAKSAPRSGTAPKKPKKTVRILKDHSDDEETGIYGELFVEGKQSEEVISDWLKRFDDDQTIALAEIVNFVLLCSGCHAKINEHDIADPDSCPSKLTDIQDEYQAQNITEYPLIAAKTRATTVKNGLMDFFRILVKVIAANEMLFKNPELMENIETWISTMSSAANRPFRHTATVASLAVVSGLAEVGNEMMEGQSKVLRQADTEKKKGKVNKARVSEMDKKAKEAARRQEELDTMAKDWFDTVFVHRYRDIDNRIRSECVEALGEWIMTYPDLFFDGQHLRYLGWVLSDTNATTRLEVVRQLELLYQDKDRIGGLKTFTERFRSRLVEMATRDADIHVRTTTIELLDTLREAGLLEPDDIDAAGKLIFDTEPRVRKAVVPFFVETINDLYDSKIEDLGGQEALDDALPQVDSEDDFETPRVEWLKLKCLVEMLESYDAESDQLMGHVEHGSKLPSYVIQASGWESRFSLAAQALYEHMPELEEWTILAGYLLYDLSRVKRSATDAESQLKNECKPSEREEVILLEVLNAAVEQAAIDAVQSTHDKKAKRTKAEKQAILESQEDDAQKLSVIVPRLLKKFGASPEAASVVLRLEHVLNLDVFEELRQGSTTYAELLDDINRQFLTHSSASVLREASTALLHAKNYEDLAEITEGKVQALWDDTINALHTLKNKHKDLTTRGNLTQAASTVLANSILRIANLASISDCIAPLEKLPPTRGKGKGSRASAAAEPTDGISIVLSLIHRGVPGDNIDPDIEELETGIVSQACRSALFYFMWKRNAISSSLQTGAAVTSSDIESLLSRRDATVEALTEVIRHRRGADELRLQAAGYILDVYALLATFRDMKPPGNNQPGDSGNTEGVMQLVQEVPRDTQKLLVQVLSAAEKAFAKRSRRHLETAPAEDDEPIGTDEDPMSEDEDDEEPEDDEDEDGEAERSKTQKQQASLVAEQMLCEYASKIVLALAARALDVKGSAMAKRLQRNKARLGPNFKEVVTLLDSKRRSAKKEREKKKAADAKAAKEKSAKSAAMVVDEDEDEAGAEQQDRRVNEDEDNEAALRERGLLEEGPGDEDEDMEDAGGQEEEPESVLGD